MKIVFFGTPQFGADVLNNLLKTNHTVSAVVCQPDSLGNRNKVVVCPVKQLALQQGLPCLQFEKVSKQGIDELKQLDADVFVTAAFGQILSQEILSLPRYGVFNVHGSLLPKYRGAAPVQFSIMNGDEITGVTIMKTALAMDSGPIAAQAQLKIEKEDNACDVLKKLADLGSEKLCKVLDLLEKGNLTLREQDEKEATYCKKIDNSISFIDWSKSAEEIFNLIRALNPNPVAYTFLNGNVFKIYKSEFCENRIEGENGLVASCDKNGLIVNCGKGSLKLLSVQIAGGKVLNFKDFINGRKIKTGDILGK